MEVSIEAVKDFEREITVVVPLDVVMEEENKRLKKYAETVEIHGFRKGKAPISIVKQRFGDKIHQDVVDNLINSSFSKAISDNKLKIAGMPRFKSLDTKPGHPLKYVAAFEVMPSFEVKGLSGIEIEQTVAEVAEQDVNNFLDKIRNQYPNWKDVERAAQNEDRVIIDFKGMMNGTPFSGGSAENYNLVLGSKQFVPGFEEGLIGVKPGSEVEVKLTFPTEYHAELAGKDVVFLVKVHKVQEKELMPLDDEFAAKFNIQEGGIAKMKEEVAGQLRRMVDSELKKINKKVIIDKLLEINPIEMPRVLIEEEAHQLQEYASKQLTKSMGKNNKTQPPSLPLDMFMERATTLVKSRLLIQKFIEDHKITLDAKRVENYLKEVAQAYEDPADIINTYTKDDKKLAEIQTAVFEDQVFDILRQEATVIEKSVSCQSLLDQNNK